MTLVGKWVRITHIAPMCLIGKLAEVLEDNGASVVISIPEMAPWDRKEVLRTDVIVVPVEEISIFAQKEELKPEVLLESKCQCGNPVQYELSVDWAQLNHVGNRKTLPSLITGCCSECASLVFYSMECNDDKSHVEFLASVRLGFKKVTTI